MESGSRGLLIVLGILVLIVVLTPVLGFGMMGSGMMGPGAMWGWRGPVAAPGGGWAWGLAMALGWLAMLAFWGAVIVGVVLLVRWLTGPTAARGGESALEILKRRYAAGELTPEDYQRMRQELER
jgi:putative membrane protein